MNKVNSINNIHNNMGEGHRRKARIKAAAKKTREQAKNDFLFDNDLHEKMSKYVLGYNPYQE